MVNSQEIVERTFYICLLNVLLEKKMGLNPEDYLPLSQEIRLDLGRGRYNDFMTDYTSYITSERGKSRRLW